MMLAICRENLQGASLVVDKCLGAKVVARARPGPQGAIVVYRRGILSHVWRSRKGQYRLQV